MNFYQKESTGYGFVASATVPCSNGNHCTLTRNYISEDGTKSISFSYDDQEYKFCLIENSTISFRQSIPFTNPLSNLNKDINCYCKMFLYITVFITYKNSILHRIYGAA